jgi:hypothetical protein
MIILYSTNHDSGQLEIKQEDNADIGVSSNGMRKILKSIPTINELGASG